MARDNINIYAQNIFKINVNHEDRDGSKSDMTKLLTIAKMAAMAVCEIAYDIDAMRKNLEEPKAL